MDLKNQNTYPLTYEFNGYQIEIKSDLNDSTGLNKNTIFINSRPLAVWQEGSDYRSIVTPFKTFPTLEETANAAVIVLNGRELSLLQEGRLGSLPEGLPDLDTPGLPRIRKNILNMTQEERDLFVQAILALKNKTNNITFNSLYDDFVKVHVDAFKYHEWGAHENALLPWHRIFLYHFESLLRAQPGFENVTLPYWDWTVKITKDKLPFTSGFMGGGGWSEGDSAQIKWVGNGPFAYRLNNWKTMTDHLVFPVTHKALSRLREDLLFERTLIDKSTLQHILTLDTFGSKAKIWKFNYSLVVYLHDVIHNEIKGDMDDHASPNDPIFWLHHCMLDKVWTDWQELHPQALHYEKDWVYNHYLDPETPLQPWKHDLNRDITINDLLDYKRLYIYEK